MAKKSEEHHRKLMVLWAADCAEHVLPSFEDYYPGDDRPRKAIEAARAWAHGNLKVSEVRSFAFAAHTAAREASKPESIAAARAAAHAAATTHVAAHAKHAASYAAKSTTDPNYEIIWQQSRLTDNHKKAK